MWYIQQHSFAFSSESQPSAIAVDYVVLGALLTNNLKFLMSDSVVFWLNSLWL